MGADRLDAQLEPLAQLLLLLILLLVVAAVFTYVLIRAAARRREAKHRKLSASRRMKDTGINLIPGADAGGEAPHQDRGRSRKSRRSSRERSGIDILRRPD
jgi:hypothetical protein